MIRTPDVPFRFLIQYAQRCPPTAEEWASILESWKHIELEIGSGNGHFLVEMATRHPDRLYLGNEVRRKRLFKSVRKSYLAQLKNIFWLWMMCEKVLESPFPNECLDVVMINFPEPWTPRKYRSRRIIQHSFLKHVWQLLKPGGQLKLVTDHPRLLMQSIDCIQEGGLFSVNDPPYDLEWPHYPRSLFEDMWRSTGRYVYYCGFSK